MRSGAQVLCGFNLLFSEIWPETEDERPCGGERTCSAESQDLLSDSGAKPAWTFCPDFPVPVHTAMRVSPGKLAEDLCSQPAEL